MPNLKFLAEEWPTISRRLDEALSLEPAQRDTWLAALSETDSIKQKLRHLLSNPASVETGDFLGTLPKLALGPDEMAEEGAAHGAAAGALIGPYQLIRELGVGGMGLVWLAERVDGGLKRQVALKLPHLSWSRGLAERMSRERDILASLDHPNIARIYDAGLDEHGRPYLALEYVEGEAIDRYSKRLGLSVQQRLMLVLQVARAVAHAHARLVVHRDLKPANILVNAEGQVRLLDFGIAKLMEGELTRETRLTQQGGRALTLDYASPEQIRGEPIGTASDVYSLGVVAYELLAEAKPYQLKRQSAAALEEAIALVDVRLASTAAASASARRALQGDLDAILNKALKKDVAERYPTVEAFAQDIERHLANLPVQARPDSAPYRFRKFVGRNRLAIGTTAMIVVSLVTGSGLAVWKAMEARNERVRTERVKDLMGSIFASANPFVSGKSEVTVRDLLKIGVDRVEHELRNEPSVSAELLSLLSSSYVQLGDIDLALRTARAANELASHAFTDSHPMRARVLRVLAEANMDKGNTGEAHQLLDQAIAIQRNLGDEGVWELAQSLHILSKVTGQEGHEEDSIALARESVDLFIRARGTNDTMTIVAIGNLSNKLMIGRRPIEALVEAERANLLASGASVDPGNPLRVLQLSNYAYALEANGQYRAARDKWKSAIELQKKTYSPQSPQGAMALLGLGRSQEFLGELKAALQSYEDSLSMMEGYGTQVSGELAIRYYSIGRVALQARQPEKAMRFLTTAIEKGSIAYGTRSSRVRDAENYRAAALVYAGRFDEAKAVLDRQIAEDRQSSAPFLLASLRNGALLDRAREDKNGSLAKLEEVRNLESYIKGNSRKALAQTLNDLGHAQLDANQLDNATESLQAAIAMFSEEQPVTTPQQADAWVALGRTQLEKGQVDEALRWLGKAVEFWDQFEPDNVFAGETSFWYGTALVRKGDQLHARQQFMRAVRLLKSSTWPSHRHLMLLARKEVLARK